MADTVRLLMCEQDSESPHCYFSNAFSPSQEGGTRGEILLDVGAAEGIISLKYVEQLKRIIIQIWEYILKRRPNDSKKIPGAFTSWDNTPRKGKAGLVVYGAAPQIFQNNLSKQIDRAKNIYKKDFLFLTAWNEWGEGCILEPTKQDGYAYLQAVKNALLENGELESD